ncbi:MAG: CDP-alcohol phosphatidyltransferase family protein, partial [Rubrobacteridae bacterium]|nr:CDP-alcohol phosphatidyltransferase family protein [Rubrobacteridae bacterium]
MRNNSNSVFKFLELPDYLTLLGGVFSVIAMLYAINEAFVAASVFLILSVLCDFYDGKIARLINRKNKVFGEVLDTCVDTISFVVAPLVFGYQVGLKSVPEVILMLVFVCAALLRLARFSCVRTTDKGYFLGMPVTYNNLIFPFAYILMHLAGLDQFVRPSFVVLFIATTFLMGS